VIRVARWFFAFCTAGLIVGGAALGYIYYHYSRGLPDHHALIDYQPATSSRLYAADGRILAEYARERRVFVPVSAMPPRLVQAFVAAEDQRFFTHPGVDFIGVMRAISTNLSNFGQGRRPEGASSITQQVAKNFLLGNEATLSRKIREAILAFRIERTFSKERIVELYLNEIFLGGGNYGVAAAALNYFDKSLDELTLGEMAYLAALPKAPNNYSITRNPSGAKWRRDYVLGRMLEDGHITQEEAKAAQAEVLQQRKRSAQDVAVAEFFAEEVRRNLIAAYGDKVLYDGGLTVRTTLDPAMQAVADQALRDGLMAYDRRHGWRGARDKLQSLDAWREELQRLTETKPLPAPKSWRLAVVLKVENTQAQIGSVEGEGTIPFAEMAWARPTLAEQTVGGAPGRPANVVQPGDVIAVEPIKADGKGKAYPPDTYALRQVPNVDGAVIAMDPQTGRILAMSGGWSYGRSQFNRAVQAQRQPGSSFKPFVYLAALNAGLTPATLVQDAPFTYDPGHGQPLWTPQNYGRDFLGPTTVRQGVERSRNLMTVRTAKHIGMDKVVSVAKQFGVTDNMAPYLPMALGAGETTLLRMTMAYAMLDNGAKPIVPSLIDRVQDRTGRTVYRHDPRQCSGCDAAEVDLRRLPQIVDPRQPFFDPLSTFQIVHIMQGVTGPRGTAGQLAKLGRPIAGKTGTTNDAKDVWFLGFTPDLVVGVYIGFDEPRTLGKMETGGFAAVPIFEQIMAEVYKGKPATPFRVPPGLRMVQVNPYSGMPAGGEGGAIWEAFKPGTEPTGQYVVLDGGGSGTGIDDAAGGGGGRGRGSFTGTGETY
jgi:penicillin-binding protein 1A